MIFETRWMNRRTAAEKLTEDDTRNKLLLGIAGAAIAAALGIACQKRISETWIEFHDAIARSLDETDVSFDA
jgi:hypothetical protein